MKKFIGIPRRLFNTRTATLLATVRKGRGEEKYTEKLYLSLRGEYFIHGSGGTLTRYNGAEDIRELTGNALDHWKQKHGIHI